MRKRSVPYFVLAVAMLAASPAPAQQDPCVAAVQAFIAERPSTPSSSIYAVLNRERERGCILGPTDTSGIEERYQVLFSGASSDIEKAVARTQLFGLALEEFAGRGSSLCEAANDPVCMVGRHVDRIRQLQAELVSSATDPKAEIVNSSNWVVQDATGEMRISRVNLRTFLSEACASDVTDAQCRDGIAVAGSIMRTSLAMNQVIAAYRLPTIEANAEFLSQRDREWDAYFNDISVQFPWELYVNSRRFSRQNRDQLEGFPRAPNDRWVVLHPSLGFEHIDTPAGDSSTNAAVFVEVLGYERWGWRNGEARNRWGLSVIASYANIPNMDSVGYGVFLHTPIRNVAIGAIRRDGDAGSETGIVANFDLAAMLQEYGNLDLAEFLAR